MKGLTACLVSGIQTDGFRSFLYGENHSLGEWFKRRLMPMM